jgi:hypothetical protein
MVYEMKLCNYEPGFSKTVNFIKYLKKLIMKRSLIILSLFMLCLMIKGQDPKPEGSVKQYYYCEVQSMVHPLKLKMTVAVDFGGEQKFITDDLYKELATGKSTAFKKPLECLNFMGEHGWELVDHYKTTVEDIGEIDCYIMKKPR